MCLSTAYKNVKSPETLLAKNITAITVEDGEVVLVDLMDNEIRVEGRLLRADLINGYVLIEAEG